MTHAKLELLDTTCDLSANTVISKCRKEVLRYSCHVLFTMVIIVVL